MRALLKQSGFSLIEMTIVLGLLAGAGLFLGQFLVQSQKGQKKVSANFDFTTKMWEVFNVLQNSSYCNSSTNSVFKERTAAGVLIPAKLSSENTPATNTVNWIGYRVGTGSSAQDIKVLAEGDVIENTLTVSEITFERQKTDAPSPQIVPAAINTPSSGKTTHYLNLIITANPTSGSGFPITKSFRLNLITDSSPTSSRNEVGGCVSVATGANARRVVVPIGLAYTRVSRSTDGAAWNCSQGICGGAFSIHRKSPDEICQDEGFLHASGSCFIAQTSGYPGGSAVGFLDANRTLNSPERMWSFLCRWNGGGSYQAPAEITCVR